MVYLVVAVFWRIPHWIGELYLSASSVCFLVYWMDKAAAVANRRRISENRLLFLGLIGGWPGAIVAQQILRHKSNKASFRSAFWKCVMLNIAGFLMLGSPFLGGLPIRCA